MYQCFEISWQGFYHQIFQTMYHSVPWSLLHPLVVILLTLDETFYSVTNGNPKGVRARKWHEKASNTIWKGSSCTVSMATVTIVTYHTLTYHPYVYEWYQKFDIGKIFILLIGNKAMCPIRVRILFGAIFKPFWLPSNQLSTCTHTQMSLIPTRDTWLHGRYENNHLSALKMPIKSIALYLLPQFRGSPIFSHVLSLHFPSLRPLSAPLPPRTPLQNSQIVMKRCSYVFTQGQYEKNPDWA